MNPLNVKLNLSLATFTVAFLLSSRTVWESIRLGNNTSCQSWVHPSGETSHNHQLSLSEDKKKQGFSRLISSPQEIYVLGERNSGTSYAASILRQAFDPPNKPDDSRTHEFFSSDIPVLKHKHIFRHSLLDSSELAEIANRTDILWIMAVRRPCDWADAMFRTPWHMCRPNDIASDCPGQFVGWEHAETLRNYTLEQFFRMEWGDWPESSNFRNLSFVSDDFIYRNVFQLRRHKLMLLKQIIDMVPRNVKIVRLHELERDPDLFIKNLVLEFNFTIKKEYEPVPPSHKVHTTKCLSYNEWEIAQREIDWNIEGFFGYGFLDCHMCYSDKSTSQSK